MRDLIDVNDLDNLHLDSYKAEPNNNKETGLKLGFLQWNASNGIEMVRTLEMPVLSKT